MPEFRCPNCGALTVHVSGDRLRCPACRHVSHMPPGQAPTTQRRPIRHARGQPARAYTSPTALWALATALLGLSLVAIILGHVAVDRIQRDPQTLGLGYAVLALILGYVGLVVTIGLLLLCFDLVDWPF